MSRRKNNQFAISLFSFQDIITSVSGVLILVVLLLILELVQRQSSDSAQKAYQASAHDIRQTIENVNVEMQQVTTDLEHAQKLIQRATENPQGELKDRIAIQTAAIDASKQQIGELQSISEEVEEAEKDVEKKEVNAQAEVAKLAQIRARIEQLEREVAALMGGGSSHYSTPQGVDGRAAWVCDSSGKGLKLYCMEDPSNRDTIAMPTQSGARDALFNELKSWLRTRKFRIDYVLIVIRPSGSDFGSLTVQRGADLRVQLGFDVITEDHKLTDSKGAPIP